METSTVPANGNNSDNGTYLFFLNFVKYDTIETEEFHESRTDSGHLKQCHDSNMEKQNLVHELLVL